MAQASRIHSTEGPSPLQGMAAPAASGSVLSFPVVVPGPDPFARAADSGHSGHTPRKRAAVTPRLSRLAPGAGGGFGAEAGREGAFTGVKEEDEGLGATEHECIGEEVETASPAPPQLADVSTGSARLC